MEPCELCNQPADGGLHVDASVCAEYLRQRVAELESNFYACGEKLNVTLDAFFKLKAEYDKAVAMLRAGRSATALHNEIMNLPIDPIRQYDNSYLTGHKDARRAAAELAAAWEADK